MIGALALQLSTISSSTIYVEKIKNISSLMNRPILKLFKILINLRILLQACLLLSATCHGLTQPPSGFVGSDTCANCHAKEFSEWKGSHHQLAMQVANGKTVLADFNDSKVNYKQRSALFFKKGQQFFVTTDNQAGHSETYQISYTFGVYPLQQYIVDFVNGKKQVLDIAWDSRPKTEGGQVWYFLGSDHNVVVKHNKDDSAHSEYFLSANSADDADFHWTGPFYNWNSRCASCHVTEFKKQYNRYKKAYPVNLSDQMSELGVGCEACHGGGKTHVNAMGSIVGSKLKHAGFNKTLKDNGVWSPLAEAVRHSTVQTERAAHTMVRTGEQDTMQVQACAGCHSRRLQLNDRDSNLSFTDNYMPMLIEPSLYHADGQVNDENFVWGSFQQSKMHKAGVTCSNCHNPHSTKLKGSINGVTDKSNVCLQCHGAADYKTEKHHKHKQTSSGSQCINCHMPAKTFMNVDKRLDHGFRIPNPILAQATNSPNACISCHKDKNIEWASIQYSKLFPTDKAKKLQPFSKAFFAALNGGQSAEKISLDLMKIATDPKQGDLVRASALVRAGQVHNQVSMMALPSLLASDSALIRLGAVRSLGSLPLQQKYSLLAARLGGSDKKEVEPSASVRIEIARQLAGVPLRQLPKQQAKELTAMFHDLIAAAEYNGDVAANLVVLADFYMARQQVKLAKSLYLEALDISPNDEAALLNLADLYRALNQDAQALPYLQRAIKAHPTSANAHYVFGLYYVRTKDMKGAEQLLKQATMLQTNNASYAYTYGLILSELRQKPAAKAFVKEWVSQNGQHPMLSKLLQSL
jgi:predicted CXXCH cytochrome family protein